MPTGVYPRPSLEDRFWKRVEKTRRCWLWRGSQHRRRGSEVGYGEIGVEDGHQKAHRVSWMLKHGPIPVGMFVLHKCDNPACVRPAHLFLGTAQDNSDDMRRKGRTNGPAGERSGKAKLTWKAVDAIRAAPRTRGSRHVLAKRFKVSVWTIDSVRKSVTWKREAKG